jgi:hypothetical protein
MNRTSFIVFLALLLAGAAVHGAITQRWSTFAPEAARRERMHALVVKYEDCESSFIESDLPLKERSIATSRQYHSTSLGFASSTSIISGIPGAVATHTPDVCYTSSGYTMIRSPKRQTITIGGQPATILVADFEKVKATQVERVRVRWAWSIDGNWDVPDYARFRYLKSPELFKLYVVTSLPADEESADDPPTVAAFVAAAFAQYGEALR